MLLDPPSSDNPDDWAAWLAQSWDADERAWRDQEPLSLWDDESDDAPPTMVVYRGARLVPVSRPSSEAEALMQAVPGDEPQEVHDPTVALREALITAVETLGDPELRALFYAYYVEGVSLREFGESMGWGVGQRAKSKAFRRKERLIQSVKEWLLGASATRALLVEAGYVFAEEDQVPTCASMSGLGSLSEVAA